MSLKKNVIANYLGSGWSAIMGLAFIPYYIEYLGMESYGLIGFYAVLQACLSLVDAGMTPTLSREMSRYSGGAHSTQSIRDLLRSLEITGFLIATFYAVFVWSSSEWLAINWLKAEKLPIKAVIQAVSIMGVVTALRFIEGLYRGAIIGLQKQVLYNIVNVTIVTLRNFGAVIVLAWYSSTIYAYFVWQGIISLISFLAFAYITYHSIAPAPRQAKFSIEELTKVWRFAAGIFVTSLLVLLLTQIDKMILSNLLTLDAFAHYNLAATVANSLLILVTPITQAHYPKMTEMQSAGDLAQSKAIFHRGSQLVTAIAGSAACLIFYFGGQLLIIWTGNQELGNKTAALAKIMTLGSMLNSFMYMPYMLQLSYGWSSFTAKTNFIAVIFLVPAIFVVTPMYGPIGAAWIWVCLNAGYVFIATHVMFKIIFKDEKIKWYKNDLIIPLMYAGGIVTIFWLIKPVFESKLYDLTFIALAGICSTICSIKLSCKVDGGG